MSQSQQVVVQNASVAAQGPESIAEVQKLLFEAAFIIYIIARPNRTPPFGILCCRPGLRPHNPAQYTFDPSSRGHKVGSSPRLTRHSRNHVGARNWWFDRVKSEQEEESGILDGGSIESYRRGKISQKWIRNAF
jgi:hypothetical protein